MPSWLKKHFKSFKFEVSEHLWLAKNKNRLVGRHQKNGNIVNDQSPVIQNDLRSNRRLNKNDKNAYRDYSKRCEEVLFYQNNCALRCAQETEKPLNTEPDDDNNVKKTDDAAANDATADAVAQQTCVKSVRNVCDNAASNECCDRNCEFQSPIPLTPNRKTFLFIFCLSSFDLDKLF